MSDTIVVQSETTTAVAALSSPDQVVVTEPEATVQVTPDSTTVVVTSQPSVETVEVNIGITGPQGPEGPQGETGATGPQGPAGSGGYGVSSWNGRTGDVSLQESDVTAVNTFSQEFMIPTDQATVTHNLGCYPSVAVVNASGETIVGDIQYIDQNTVQITFTGANIFTVYCN